MTVSIPPRRRDFFQDPLPPLWKFQLSFIHFFKLCGLTATPTPYEIPIPYVGEYGYLQKLHIKLKLFILWGRMFKIYILFEILSIFILRF